MASIYDLSMLMLADTIIDTFSPTSVRDTLQIEPTMTDFQKLPSIVENDDLDLDPIPIDSETDDAQHDALVSFAAPLDYFFLNNENKENKDPISETRKTTTNSSKPSPNTARRIRAKKRAFPKTKNSVALEYRKNDVLLGRGGHASSNPGNLYLLRAVRMSQPEYKGLGQTEQDKVQKRAIVQHIVKLVEERGSRFLYREKKGEQWREASSRAVYEKISHMLRD